MVEFVFPDDNDVEHLFTFIFIFVQFGYLCEGPVQVLLLLFLSTEFSNLKNVIYKSSFYILDVYIHYLC